MSPTKQKKSDGKAAQSAPNKKSIAAKSSTHAHDHADADHHAPHSHSAIASTGERKATHVDADARARNMKRLRRIEGQVRGLQKMVEEDRYCADVLTQIASVHEALRSVGRELMRNHLKHCATGAIRAGEPKASAMYDELVDMMYKHSR